MPVNDFKYFGANLLTQLVESPGSPSRVADLHSDKVTRKYRTRFANVTTLIPGYGTAQADFPNHFLVGYAYNRTGEADYTDVTLNYETANSGGGGGLNPEAPLPPDEIEYIAGTTERHLGAHPDYSANKAWLGNPKTIPPGKKSESDAIDDPRGQPTTAPTKPGVEAYLIPTGVYRKISYSHTLPQLSIQTIATRNIPPGESGANKWLYTGYTLKITKGVYQLSQEWTFLPIGTWDTDIYD
jgi:hypothetical protein